MPEEKAKAKQYFTYDQYGDNIMVPVGPLIVIPIGASKFCEQVNAWLYDRRQAYFLSLIHISEPTRRSV